MNFTVVDRLVITVEILIVKLAVGIIIRSASDPTSPVEFL